MGRKTLLEQIWNGSVALFCHGEVGEIAQGIRALMPVETVSLTNAACHGLPRVMSDSEELLPGLSLGDVLSEELGIDVPFGALVVFEEVGEGSAATIGTGEALALRHIAGSSGKAARVVEAGSLHLRAGAEHSGFRDGGLNAQFFGARPGQGAKPAVEVARHLSQNDRALG